MELEWAITIAVSATSIFMLVVSWVAHHHISKSKESLIRAQQDTIHRLINREPVTYQEVGAKPSKPSRERYAAWGNQMVDMDEDERH